MPDCVVHFNYGDTTFIVYREMAQALLELLVKKVKNQEKLVSHELHGLMKADTAIDFVEIFNCANVAGNTKFPLIVSAPRVGESKIQIKSITEEAKKNRGTPYVICTFMW